MSNNINFVPKVIRRPVAGVPIVSIVNSTPQSQNLVNLNYVGTIYQGGIYGNEPEITGELAMFRPYRGIPISQDIYLMR